jgi:D-alanyl-D-alanine carboxypeptidase
MLLAISPIKAESLDNISSENVLIESIDEEITVETMNSINSQWNAPSISAHSAILIDAQTGEVLY